MDNIPINKTFKAFRDSIFSIKISKKHCQLCGTLFPVWQNRRYCSTKCSRDARRIKVRHNVMALSKRRNFGKITITPEQINRNIARLNYLKYRHRLGNKFISKSLIDAQTYDKHSLFSQYEKQSNPYDSFDKALAESGGHIEDESDYIPENDYAEEY